VLWQHLTVSQLPSSLVSARLELHLFQQDDLEALATAVQESIEHLAPWMAWWVAEEPLSREDQLARIDRWHQEWADGKSTVYGVFREGVVIGSVGFLFRSADGTVREIGYWLHPDHVGHGYATEASRVVVDAAFMRLPYVQRVEIRHDKANDPSAGVPRRLGFTYVGETAREKTAASPAGVDWVWAVNREGWTESQHARP